MRSHHVKLADILTGIAVIVSALALIISVSQTFYIGRQARLTADQTESDNIAKTSDLVKNIQFLQTSVFRLARWNNSFKDSYDNCVASDGSGTKCESFSSFLKTACTDSNSDCAKFGLPNQLVELVIAASPGSNQKVESNTSLISVQKWLRFMSNLFKVRHSLEPTGNSLDGAVASGLDTCGYFAAAEGSTDDNYSQSRWEAMQLTQKIVPLLVSIGQNSSSLHLKLENNLSGSSEALAQAGNLIDSIKASLQALEELYSTETNSAPSGHPLAGGRADLAVVAWAIAFVEENLRSELDQCKSRRNDVIENELNIRKTIDLDAQIRNQPARWWQPFRRTDIGLPVP